jgi:threonine/homoserine/homoserine lactone efflux protein
MSAFWEGVIAGYGIAIPVGAIAILIVETALRQGFFSGFMAGAGAATADLIYATIAVLAGVAVAAALAPYAASLKIISSIVLLALGSYGLWRAIGRRNQPGPNTEEPGRKSRRRTYWQFLGLTLLNPLTVVYFGALILSRDPTTRSTTADGLAFITGAALASLSWQTLLAGSGALAKKLLSPHFQLYASVIGNLVVIGLGFRILISL